MLPFGKKLKDISNPISGVKGCLDAYSSKEQLLSASLFHDGFIVGTFENKGS